MYVCACRCDTLILADALHEWFALAEGGPIVGQLQRVLDSRGLLEPLGRCGLRICLDTQTTISNEVEFLGSIGEGYES